MVAPEPAEAGATRVFRPCNRAFLVYYVAMAICFLGPQINPAAGLPPWLGILLGLIVAAAVVYMRWGQEYQVTPRGVSKVWRWGDRRQDIAWENLGEVLVRRGLTQTLLQVGNLLIRDKSGAPDMFWFGLTDPKGVKALIEERSR
ncbi:MAG: hypothetical protein A2Z73_00805 [Deltaproteobacteria bacterium RBG_13_60_28]|nr:MAG: hypothetical protein A2Z73_00805 [Deltaproteobacteria bacterium RBG_13_60_28]